MREKVQRQGGGGAAGERVPGVAGRRRRGGHQAGAVARRRARLRSAQSDTGASRHTARARAAGDQPERQVDGGDARGGDRGPGRPRGGRAVPRDQGGQLLHERHVGSLGTGDGGERRRRRRRWARDGAARGRQTGRAAAASPDDVGRRRPSVRQDHVQRDGDHEQQAHRGRRGLRAWRPAARGRLRAHRPLDGRRQPGQRHTRDQAERHTRSEGRLRHARHAAAEDRRVYIGRRK